MTHFWLTALLVTSVAAGPARAVNAAAMPDPVVEISLRDPARNDVLAQAVVSNQRDSDVRRQTTAYAAADGISLGVEELAEFRGDELSLFISHDSRSGERVEVRVGDDGTFHIESREGPQVPPRVSRLKAPRGTVLGPSIPALLMRHWSALKAGETVRFPLLVPEHRDTYVFRARREPDPSPGAARIVVDADAWLIRAFAPTLEFHFAETPDAAHPRLRELLAPSPVVIDGQRHRPVRLVFAVPES